MPDPNNYTPIDEVEEWKATIPALQDGWQPNGGPVDPANNGGLLNWPLLHLASRTLWLKAQAEQLATDLANIDVTAQINAAIDALVNGAPAALDTLSELATALQGNDDEIAALVGSIAGKLSKDQNLADLTDVNAAWNNLYIKSAASYDVIDNPNLAVDGGKLALRSNVAAAIASGKYESPETDVALGTTTTFAHGLGVMPSEYSLRLKCLIAEHGYSVGDETELSQNQSTSGDFAEAAVWANGTEVGVRTYTAVHVFSRSTEARSVITTANWKFIARARK
jgi:hypothetical protein